MIRVVEAFSDGLPSWLTRDKQVVKGLNNVGIDLTSAIYRSEPAPKIILGTPDRRMEDPNRLSVYGLSWPLKAYIPGVTDPEVEYKGNYTRASELPIEDMLKFVNSYGYFDLTDSENLKTGKQAARKAAKDGMPYRGRGQYQYRYDVEYGKLANGYDDPGNVLSYKTGWTTSGREDKSGYLPDPYKYVSTLYKANKNNYAKRVQRMYNSITKVKSRIASALSDINLDTEYSDEESNFNFVKVDKAQSYLQSAIRYYSSILKSVSKIDSGDREFVRRFFNDDEYASSFAALSERVYVSLQQAKEYLNSIQ